MSKATLTRLVTLPIDWKSHDSPELQPLLADRGELVCDSCGEVLERGRPFPMIGCRPGAMEGHALCPECATDLKIKPGQRTVTDAT